MSCFKNWFCWIVCGKTSNAKPGRVSLLKIRYYMYETNYLQNCLTLCYNTDSLFQGFKNLETPTKFIFWTSVDSHRRRVFIVPHLLWEETSVFVVSLFLSIPFSSLFDKQRVLRTYSLTWSPKRTMIMILTLLTVIFIGL